MTLKSNKKNRVNTALNLVIVEDDPLQASLLSGMVAEYHASSSSLFYFDIRVFSTPVELSAALSAGFHVDIVIMDIDFGSDSLTGVEAVDQWFPSGCGTQVIYVSGYSEYCTAVYRTEHVYFLLKPCEQQSMNDALDKALERVRSYRQKTLAVKVRGSVIALPVDSITHVESNRRKILIHTITSDVETYGSIAEMISSFPDSFVQCHKSFLVNMRHVDQLQNNEISLSTGTTIPVSQKRRKAVQESFMKYARELISLRGN